MQERDFVYVSDVARAFEAALVSGSRSSINLGSGRGTSVLEIRDGLDSLIGRNSETHFQPARPGEVYRIYLTGEQAWAHLGWKPEVSLTSGLAQTLSWVRETAGVTA